MDKVIGYLGLLFLILSLLPVPMYVFAGGTRRQFGYAGVHTGVIAIGFGLFGSLLDTTFFVPFIVLGISIMGYLTYFAAVETGLIKPKHNKR